MTYVDLAVYIEIDTIKTLFNTGVPSNCPNLAQWYDKLKKDSALSQVNRNFYELVNSQKLAIS